jgi:5-(carboxyamino)imidazole ribonucleotide synthase
VSPILPGATLGVLGSGQLGRMFAIAAREMGYRVHILSPEVDSPAGQIADREVVARYDDLDAVEQFAKSVAVVTFEFENISAASTERAARFTPVRPGGHVLYTTQHRLREKDFLTKAGIPVTSYAAVHSADELAAAAAKIGLPAVLKTAAWGYDGKGQAKLDPASDLAAAWASLKTDEAILEGFVDFEREVSIVTARGLDGQCVFYGPIDNAHRNHILDLSICPADVPTRVADDARAIAATIMRELDVVGVLCVEMFLTRGGRLLVNELAPRPHNSGHLTIDAHATSQFEQQVRAVCGLPLGSTRQHSPAAMANLLGDVWSRGEPRWPAALALPDVKLHLYGKHDPRPGRKMGHLTALAATPAEAARVALAARDAL